MAQWVELLINISAFAGFVGVATWWAKKPTGMRR
jgi:nitrogen fixation-related uncharacterized protein